MQRSKPKRRLAGIALAAALASGAVAAMSDPSGAVVSNPGPITLSGNATLVTSSGTLGPFPGSVAGTVDGAGNISIPQANVDFPPHNGAVNVEGLGEVAVTIDVQANSPWTGFVNPDTGLVTLQGDIVTLFSALGVIVNCPLGPSSLSFSTANTGGIPYNNATGTATVTDPAFSMPAIAAGTPGCAPFVDTVNETLQLPTDAAGPISLVLTISPLLEGEPPPPPGAPKAVADTAKTKVGEPVVIDVLANDEADASAAIDPTTLGVTANPANGTAVVDDGKVTYTPNAGFAGVDSFRYEICSVEAQDESLGPCHSTGVDVTVEDETVAATTTTSAAPTTTAPTAAAAPQLPQTGSTSAPLAGIGVGAVLLGLVLALRNRRIEPFTA